MSDIIDLVYDDNSDDDACFVKAFTADIDKNLIDFPPKVHSFMFLTQITTHTHHMLRGGKNMSLLNVPRQSLLLSYFWKSLSLI